MRYFLVHLGSLFLIFPLISSCTDDCNSDYYSNRCVYNGEVYKEGNLHPTDTCVYCFVTSECSDLFGKDRRLEWVDRCCYIDGHFYLNGQKNPLNDCQICISHEFHEGHAHYLIPYPDRWTNVWYNTPCYQGHCDGDGNCTPE